MPKWTCLLYSRRRADCSPGKRCEVLKPRRRSSLRSYLGLLRGMILLCFAGAGQAQLPPEAPALVLAAAERRPYLGDNLPRGGYVQQLVREVFEQQGWRVEIRFYPRARALAVARNGGADGLVPTYAASDLEPAFSLSASFPGDRLGLMKAKRLTLNHEPGTGNSIEQWLEALRAYRFGYVRGAAGAELMAAVPKLAAEAATTDAENLNKLFRGRIDLALIDKYTAADLMTSRFPHMIGKLEFLPEGLTAADFHVAFSRATGRAVQLKEVFDRGLKQLHENGRLQQILAEHGLLERRAVTPLRQLLRIGVVDNPHLQTLRHVSGQFEKTHPDISLEWVVLDEPVLRLRALSDVALDDGRFDVVAIGPFEAGNWARRGWLTPLVALPADYAVDDILAPIRTAFSHQGTLYALPLYAETSVTYYRQDLFEQAGLEMPEWPRYDQIRDFAERLHAPEQGLYGACLRGDAGWGANMAYVNTLVNSFGGRWFDPDWNPTLDTPAWREALSYYRDLLTRYGPPEPTQLDYNRILKLFQDGHCAIWVDASSLIDALLNPKNSKIAGSVGMAHAPVARTTRGAAWLWSWGLAVPDSSKAKVAAQQFIRWATSPEYVTAVVASEGWLSVPPGTRASTYGDAYRQALPYAGRIFEAIRATDPDRPTLLPVPYHGIQYVGIPEYTALGDQVGLLVQQLLRGDISVETATTKAQQLAERQMRESGYLP